MQSLIPDKSTFLSRPTRVSRLYPALTVALMVASSGLTYWWQVGKITAETAIQERDMRISALASQVNSLTEQREQDQAVLAAQEAEIRSTTERLGAIEAELNTKQKELAEAQNRLKSQESQLSNNAAELAKLRSRPPLFNFHNDSSLPDAAAKQEHIKEVVTNAYDYIQELYGAPYLLNQVTISFVDSLSIANSAGEIIIENGRNGISITIRLKDFDKNRFQDVNTIIHEIIHGFHGIAVLESSALEEGMAVAATDAVMERMIADGKLPQYSHLYITVSPSTYQTWNQTITVPASSNAFYSHPKIAQIYQMAGYAWRELYRIDANFFKRLNERYYKKVQAGQQPTDAMIKAEIANIIPSVGGQPTAQYLSEQAVFNPR